MKQIGRTYIIAEAGVNHNGSMEMAMQLIDVAAACGADAVKFQTFRASRLVSESAGKAEYQKRTTTAKESQYEMIKRLELDEAAHEILYNHCRAKGIEFLSTPFDVESLHFLVNKLEVPIIKIASGEITNAPFLLDIARTGKPVIMSTGMSTLGDIEMALGVLTFGYLGIAALPGKRAFELAYFSKEGQAMIQEKVTLLHCTTEYPTPFEEVNLQVLDTLARAFAIPVGFSDHTPGIAIPIGAVAKGAVIIEKHFTLDRNLPGPDHKASLEPKELQAMIQGIRQLEQALGSSLKLPAPSEAKNIEVARKSLIAAKDIKKGEQFSMDNLAVKRPGMGLSPICYWDWLGRRAERDYAKDELVGL